MITWMTGVARSAALTAMLASLVLASGLFVALISVPVLEALRDAWSWWGVIGFPAAFLLGVLFEQAKDVASQRHRSGNPWSNAWSDLKVAYTCDEYGPPFLFRLLGWLGLTIAGVLLAAVFTARQVNG